MNPYEILEVRPGASADEVKASYHRLAKQWHPDRFTGEQKSQAEHKFRQLSEAFNMLRSVLPRSAEPAAPPVPPAPAAAPKAAPAPASPATGLAKVHAAEQAALVAEALTV